MHLILFLSGLFLVRLCYKFVPWLFVHSETDFYYDCTVLGSGQNVKERMGWSKRGVGQQVLSLNKGVDHPIFEPLEGRVLD